MWRSLLYKLHGGMGNEVRKEEAISSDENTKKDSQVRGIHFG